MSVVIEKEIVLNVLALIIMTIAKEIAATALKVNAILMEYAQKLQKLVSTLLIQEKCVMRSAVVFILIAKNV